MGYNGLRPMFLADMFQRYTPSRVLRSQDHLIKLAREQKVVKQLLAAMPLNSETNFPRTLRWPHLYLCFWLINISLTVCLFVCCMHFYFILFCALIFHHCHLSNEFYDYSFVFFLYIYYFYL